MNRMAIAVIAGAVLGIVDGLTAWFYPEVRAQLLGIVIGSTLKGAIGGVLIGLFARKIDRMGPVLLFGAIVGALLALGVASLQHAHYAEIIVPGTLVGLITAYVTVRYGRAATVALR